MNYAETARLLATISAIDNRRIDEATVATWHGVLGDLPADPALAAVRRHFARSTEWLMPAHIRDGVRLIREEQRSRSEALALPSRWEADPDRDVRVRRGVARVAAALTIARESRPRAVEATEKPPPSRSDEIRAAAIRRAVSERGSTRMIEAPRWRTRRTRTGPTDYATTGVPGLGPVRACDACRGNYTDDPAGIGAHRTVMGHSPTEAA